MNSNIQVPENMFCPDVSTGIILNPKITTSRLWEETHKALHNNEWGKARVLLDELGKRDDNYDKLLSAKQYGLVGYYAPIIQDRIDLVNSKVF